MKTGNNTNTPYMMKQALWIILLPISGMNNITYKYSRCFNLYMENGVFLSRLLEDKSLDQNRIAVRSISYRNIGMVIKGTRNANFIRKNPAKEKKGGGALRLKRSFLKKENNISKTET